MGLIDEEGNVLGKINIIDLLVVMAVSAVLVAGVAFVVSGGDGTESSPEYAESTILFRSDGQPDYVVNSIEPGPVPSGAVVGVESIAVNQTEGTNVVWLKLTVRAIVSDDGKLLWGQERLYVGRTVTIDLRKVQLEGVVVDFGPSVELPTIETTDTPTPVRTTSAPPDESTHRVEIRVENVPPYIERVITEGPVNVTPDIVAVTNKTVTNASEGNGHVVLDVELVVTEDSANNGALMYRGSRLYVGRSLRLDLGETIVKGVVIDIY